MRAPQWLTKTNAWLDELLGVKGALWKTGGTIGVLWGALWGGLEVVRTYVEAPSRVEATEQHVETHHHGDSLEAMVIELKIQQQLDNILKKVNEVDSHVELIEDSLRVERATNRARRYCRENPNLC